MVVPFLEMRAPVRRNKWCVWSVEWMELGCGEREFVEMWTCRWYVEGVMCMFMSRACGIYCFKGNKCERAERVNNSI
jgi:hypothetical protein